MSWAVIRNGPYGWGKVILGLALLLVGCGVVVVVVGSALAMVTATGEASPGPVVAVLQMAVIGLWALVVVAVARLLWKMRAGDLVSWVPGVRWGLLGKASLVSVVGLGVNWVGLLLVAGKPLVVPDGVMIGAFVLALLLIPIQALAEELLFRAFGPQLILGKMGFTTLRFAVVSLIYSLLFASAHGASSLSIWVVFVILGGILAYLVYKTGGIEAAVALHALNNVFVVIGGMLRGKDASQSGGFDISVVIQVLIFIAIAAVIVRISRKERAASPTFSRT